MKKNNNKNQHQESSVSMTSETHDFSERLQQALRNAEYAPDSPTRLAREFNVRFAGNPITVHAARKWLIGESIPTQEKLRTLADWLGVSAEWLRFGTDVMATKMSSPTHPDFGLQPKDLAIIENLKKLDDEHRLIVGTLVRQLVRASGRK
jgi:transcriptional regulator with XRE-family HTH domain